MPCVIDLLREHWQRLLSPVPAAGDAKGAESADEEPHDK